MTDRGKEDWYVLAIADVERSAADLRLALDQVIAALHQARRERLAGGDLVQIVEHLRDGGGKVVRLAPTVAFRAFEQAISAYRAATIRALVDECGMTFSDVSQLIGVSRQMVARLYRAW